MKLRRKRNCAFAIVGADLFVPVAAAFEPTCEVLSFPIRPFSSFHLSVIVPY